MFMEASVSGAVGMSASFEPRITAITHGNVGRDSKEDSYRLHYEGDVLNLLFW